MCFRVTQRTLTASHSYGTTYEGASTLSTLPNTPEPVHESRETRRESAIRGHILFTFFVILMLAVAWRVRSVLELIYVSGLFAVILTPLVTRLTNIRFGKHRLSRVWAIVTLVGSVFVTLSLFFFFALPPVIRDLHEFLVDLPGRVPAIVARIHHLPMADKLGVDSMVQRAEDAATATASYMFTSFPKWMEAIFNVVMGFVLCLYFMIEGEHAYRWFLTLFTEDNRIRVHQTMANAETRMSRWLLGQGMLMLTFGVTSTIVFGLLHLRYFVLLGFLMGLFNIIPVAGGIISILIAACVAALDSWTKMGLVFLFYVIYINIESAVLTPRIMKAHVDLMGLTVLIALLLGSAMAGIVGALVAVPSAVLVSCFLQEFFVERK